MSMDRDSPSLYGQISIHSSVLLFFYGSMSMMFDLVLLTGYATHIDVTKWIGESKAPLRSPTSYPLTFNPYKMNKECLPEKTTQCDQSMFRPLRHPITTLNSLAHTMAQPPPEESNPSPTHPAPLQLNREDLETRAAELLTETQERQQRHHEIEQTVGLIMNLTHGVPSGPYSAMVHQAAAPTLIQEQDKLRAVGADLVTLMMKTREIAGTGKRLEGMHAYLQNRAEF